MRAPTLRDCWTVAARGGVAYPPPVDRRDDYTAMLADQDRIARDERAEAMTLLRTGHAVRVWRDGRILVLASFPDIDRVWPQTYRARGGVG